MKIVLSFDELSNVLGYANTIINDKTVEDKMKNIIFLVKKEEVSIVGYSALTFSRTQLQEVEVIGVEDAWDFQIKAGDLNKIIASFSNLYKTRVKKVEFEKINNKIRMLLHEEAISGEDGRLSQDVSFLLDSGAILSSVSKEIHMQFPEDTDSVLSGDLLIYIDSLFPDMSNDSLSSLSSKLNFASEYVFVITSTFSTFFNNKLPDSFKGLTLGYSSVNFLKKLCEGSESIEVKRIDKYLCINSGLTEAFLRYQPVKIRYESYLKDVSKDMGIVVDRLYFKDVLKRMLISGNDGVAQVVDGGLEVSNSGFSQIVPLNNKKGEVENIKFKLPIQHVIKTITGSDSIFPGELFLYFVRSSSSGYLVYVMDRTGSWLSRIQVRS